MPKRYPPNKRHRGLYFIYALIDPRDEKVRYIGSTKNPKYRYVQHFARPVNPLVEGWIQELKNLNLQPRMMTLAEEPRGMFHAKSLEDRYIYEYGLYQGGLLNMVNPIQSLIETEAMNIARDWFVKMKHDAMVKGGHFYRAYQKRLLAKAGRS